MELGYLGPEGSYSYEAALEYSKDGILTPMASFSAIIEAVDKGMLDGGILPMENSTEGVVTSVADALYSSHNIHIVKELVLPIIHNLYSTDGDIKSIRYVYSHLQAIEQCRKYLARSLPDIVPVPCESTSRACEIAREKGAGYGAIANSLAAKRNGLVEASRNLNDNCSNKTRFVAIGREQARSTGRDKTSIVFTFDGDGPGSLYGVLGEFAREKINLARIESRPAKTELGKYAFFIDFEGHMEDKTVARVLERVRQLTKTLKIMGSYPACL